MSAKHRRYIWPKLTHAAVARSLCDSWASCLICWAFWFYHNCQLNSRGKLNRPSVNCTRNTVDSVRSVIRKRIACATTRCNRQYRGAILRIKRRLLHPIDQTGFHYPTLRERDTWRLVACRGRPTASEWKSSVGLYSSPCRNAQVEVSNIAERHTSRVIVSIVWNTAVHRTSTLTGMLISSSSRVRGVM